MSKNCKILYGLWEYNPNNIDKKLLSILTNITKHFFKLTAAGSIKFQQSTQLSILLNSAEKNNCDWCVIFLPGTILKHGFSKKIFNELSSSKSNISLIAHLIDRKNRGIGFNEQFFIVNVKQWVKQLRPDLNSELKPINISRSKNNVHDDYTPLWVKVDTNDNSSTSKYLKPYVFGSNFLSQMLDESNMALNICDEIRNHKEYLYPEQNSSQLYSSLLDINGPLDFDLTEHQRQIISWLSFETGSGKSKFFLFNTERFLDIKEVKPKFKLDYIYTLASGTKDLYIANHFGLHKNSEFFYYDICNSALEFKKDLWDNWDGNNYANFISQHLKSNKDQFYRNNTSLTFDGKQIKSLLDKELSLWGSKSGLNNTFLKYKDNKKIYNHIDLITSQEIILKHIDKNGTNKNVALWYSNCFNYTPILAKHGWDIEKIENVGFEFFKQLNITAKKINCNILVFGEDIITGTTPIKSNNTIQHRYDKLYTQGLNE